jgi:hypothetical protein
MQVPRSEALEGRTITETTFDLRPWWDSLGE